MCVWQHIYDAARDMQPKRRDAGCRCVATGCNRTDPTAPHRHATHDVAPSSTIISPRKLQLATCTTCTSPRRGSCRGPSAGSMRHVRGMCSCMLRLHAAVACCITDVACQLYLALHLPIMLPFDELVAHACQLRPHLPRAARWRGCIAVRRCMFSIELRKRGEAKPTRARARDCTCELWDLCVNASERASECQGAMCGGVCVCVGGGGG